MVKYRINVANKVGSWTFLQNKWKSLLLTTNYITFNFFSKKISCVLDTSRGRILVWSQLKDKTFKKNHSPLLPLVQNCSLLYCTVFLLYSTVLHCIVKYCTALFDSILSFRKAGMDSYLYPPKRGIQVWSYTSFPREDSMEWYHHTAVPWATHFKKLYTTVLYRTVLYRKYCKIQHFSI